MFLTADLLSLFLISFSAATLLPGGSEVALLALSADGRHGPALLLCVASLGNILGSVVNYWLGRAALGFRHHRLFPVSQQQLDKAQSYFSRWGHWSLLLAWMPVIGDPLTVAAGAMRCSFLTFCLLVSLGKIVRYMAILGLFTQIFS
ncbi:MAG: DedA family protein [Cohaesibacter sp.]|nr:DedA family protein [Cohaesibacter sp.]MCV6601783.1 DedA family protein [Cohaesibacter sp.]